MLSEETYTYQANDHLEIHYEARHSFHSSAGDIAYYVRLHHKLLRLLKLYRPRNALHKNLP